jgi:hypothetical protein
MFDKARQAAAKFNSSKGLSPGIYGESTEVERGLKKGKIIPKPTFRKSGNEIQFPKPTPRPTSNPRPEHETHAGEGDVGPDNTYKGVYTGKPNIRGNKNYIGFVKGGGENAKKYLSPKIN